MTSPTSPMMSSFLLFFPCTISSQSPTIVALSTALHVFAHVWAPRFLTLLSLSTTFCCNRVFRSKRLVLQNSGVMDSALFISAERLAGHFLPCLLFLSSPCFLLPLWLLSLQSGGEWLWMRMGEGTDFFAKGECFWARALVWGSLLQT